MCIVDTYINRRVLGVYRRVMALPEGPTSTEYRKDVRRQVRDLPQEYKDDILSRAEEIEERSWDDFLARQDILLELGFTSTEAAFLARCRLNSPGIRTLIKERVTITRFAKANEIQLINDGDVGVLRMLKMLYIDKVAE